MARMSQQLGASTNLLQLAPISLVNSRETVWSSRAGNEGWRVIIGVADSARLRLCGTIRGKRCA